MRCVRGVRIYGVAAHRSEKESKKEQSNWS